MKVNCYRPPYCHVQDVYMNHRKYTNYPQENNNNGKYYPSNKKSKGPKNRNYNHYPAMKMNGYYNSYNNNYNEDEEESLEMQHYTDNNVNNDHFDFKNPYFNNPYDDIPFDFEKPYNKPSDEYYHKSLDKPYDKYSDHSDKHYDQYYDKCDGQYYDKHYYFDDNDKFEDKYCPIMNENINNYPYPEEADFPTKKNRVNLLLLPEHQTGVPTDPTGIFAEEYCKYPEKLFKSAYGYAILDRDFPLKLDITLYAPRPEDIGFCGWKYEGWLVDQGPQGRYSSATSENPRFEGIINPDLDEYDYPLTTGIFRDTGLTLPNGLGVYKNTLYMDQSAWPYDMVVVTLEPPETGKGMKNYDPRPNPVRPVTGAIPGSIPKERY